MLLEKWMSNAVQCCESAGIAPPTSALQMLPVIHPSTSSSPPLPHNQVITPPPLPSSTYSDDQHSDVVVCIQ